MGATYATAAFAELLGISKASLQHYIAILEEQGYEVRRNSRMHRQFTEEDILLLQAFLILYKQHGMKLKEAAQEVLKPSFKPTEIVQNTIIPANNEISKFEDISNSMQLIATHIYGIEQQNMQLITLIEEQRTQNELLIEQNHTLKQQFAIMMQHVTEQSALPNPEEKRQLDRLEQQNSAIMNVLNKLIVAQSEKAVTPDVEIEKQTKGLLSKFFK